MTKLTNYAPGPRGITLKDGSTVWLNPGQSETFDKGQIVEPLPDLGQKGAPVEDTGDDGLKAQVAELTDQLAAVTKERDGLKAQVAKFDSDGDGKAGGSKPAAK